MSGKDMWLKLFIHNMFVNIILHKGEIEELQSRLAQQIDEFIIIIFFFFLLNILSYNIKTKIKLTERNFI
jgi:hypothetical protein